MYFFYILTQICLLLMLWNFMYTSYILHYRCSLNFHLGMFCHFCLFCHFCVVVTFTLFLKSNEFYVFLFIFMVSVAAVSFIVLSFMSHLKPSIDVRFLQLFTKNQLLIFMIYWFDIYCDNHQHQGDEKNYNNIFWSYHLPLTLLWPVSTDRGKKLIHFAYPRGEIWCLHFTHSNINST